MADTNNLMGKIFPCVKIKDIYHITVNSNTCLCGKKWTYGSVNMNSRLVITNPIKWKEWEEITCDVCKQALISKENVKKG